MFLSFQALHNQSNCLQYRVFEALPAYRKKNRFYLFEKYNHYSIYQGTIFENHRYYWIFQSIAILDETIKSVDISIWIITIRAII